MSPAQGLRAHGPGSPIWKCGSLTASWTSVELAPSKYHPGSLVRSSQAPLAPCPNLQITQKCSQAWNPGPGGFHSFRTCPRVLELLPAQRTPATSLTRWQSLAFELGRRAAVHLRQEQGHPAHGFFLSFPPCPSQAPLTPGETHSISWGPKRMAEKESSGAGVETPRVEAAPRQPGRGEVRDGMLTFCLPGLGLPAPKNPGVLLPQLPVSFPAFLLPS